MTRRIEAEAIIKAKDATGGAFNSIAAKFKNLTAQAKAASAKAGGASRVANSASIMSPGGAIGRPMAGVGRAAGMIGAGMLGLPGAGVAGAMFMGVQAEKRYAETDLALTRIGITADATDEQIRALDKTVRTTAFDTGSSFDQVAKGLESLVAGGMDLDKALPAIPAISRTAQAAGAEIKDMADTALSLNQALGISTDKMQSAFDIMVVAGKEGKFELKDMAANMASLLPTAQALGYKGEEGLRKIVSMMQAIRAGTGSSQEAADSMTNIFQKIESSETVTKFKKGGVDLRKEMDATRKSGGDMIQSFMKQLDIVTKGDASKIPQFIQDLQFARGIRALKMYGDLFEKTMQRTGKAAGAGDRDLERVLERPQMALNRLAESYDRLKTSLGALLDKVGASKALDWAAKDLENTAENGLKPPWALRDGSSESNAEKDALDAALQQNRDLLQKGERDTKRGNFVGFGPMGGKNDPAGEAARMQAPGLQALRLKIFDLERGRDAVSADAQNRSLFTPAEVEQWRKDESVRKTTVEFPGMTDDAEANKKILQRKRVIGTMGWDKPAPTTVPGGDNILDPQSHGPVTAELTGTANVEGEAKVTVVVEPSSELLKIATQYQETSAQLKGMLKAGNGPGSNGRSSPDAKSGGRGAGGGF